MKVLQVDKFLRRFGGAAGYMLDLGTAQQTHGHEVEYFSMQHPDNLQAKYTDYFPPYVEFGDSLSGLKNRVVAASTMLWSRKAETGMAAVLADFRPDVVHVHNIYHQLSPSVLRAAKKAGVPVVMTVHDYKLICPTYEMTRNGSPCTACVDGSLWEAARNRCMGSPAASILVSVESSLHRTFGAYAPVDSFVVPSRFLGQMFDRAGVFGSRIRVVPHGIQLAPEPQYGGRDGSVLFAGRLASGKGIDVLIRAIGALDGVRLRILGDGPERSALESIANDVAPGQVVFEGHCSKEQVQGAYRSSSVGVLPARWFENQPMSILEGMANGLPFVASNLGGIPELIIPDETGQLVPAEDHAELAQVLRRLLNNEDERLRLAVGARKFVSEHHGFDHHLAAVETIYREALSR